MTLQLGIVGLGRMGRFHAAAIVGVEEVEVVALAEPSPEPVPVDRLDDLLWPDASLPA